MFQIVHSRRNEFVDASDDSWGYFFDPPSGWANVADCGNFPCTGPWNVLFYNEDITFTGN
jgi:hypothetical protein